MADVQSQPPAQEPAQPVNPAAASVAVAGTAAGVGIDVAARLAACGIRATDQRLQIAAILLSASQHLSAERIGVLLDQGGARVSKATVYNTLNLFAARGLIRQLAIGDDCAWFDSNIQPHYHFHDERTGALSDVALNDVEFSRLPAPPEGMEFAGIDLVIRLRRRD